MTSPVDVCVLLYKPDHVEARLLAELPQLTKSPHAVHVIDNSKNEFNLSSGWNHLAAKGNAPYIAILNSDVVLSPGWDELLIEYLAAHPEVGSVLPTTMRWDPSGRTASENAGKLLSPGEMAEWASYARANLPGQHITFAVPAGDTASFFAVMVRRKDFESIKGFDERLRFCGNDGDYQWRQSERGLRTVMVKFAVMGHVASHSIKKGESNGKWSMSREFSLGYELMRQIQGGKLRKWQDLTDGERLAVRSDPKYKIGS